MTLRCGHKCEFLLWPNSTLLELYSSLDASVSKGTSATKAYSATARNILPSNPSSDSVAPFPFETKLDKGMQSRLYERRQHRVSNSSLKHIAAPLDQRMLPLYCPQSLRDGSVQIFQTGLIPLTTFYKPQVQLKFLLTEIPWFADYLPILSRNPSFKYNSAY
jgi:hypothetical protein